MIVCYSRRFSTGSREKRVFSWFSQQLHAVIACRAQGSCSSAAWEGSAKALSVGRTNSRHIFTKNIFAKTVPVPANEIEKHLWSFLTLLLYLLTMFLRHCLAMRNALHLLKIPPASLLTILNCWVSVLGSTPEGIVPMLPAALGMWLAAEDAVVVIPQAGISCRFMYQTQICIKISPCSICHIFYFWKKRRKIGNNESLVRMGW